MSVHMAHVSPSSTGTARLFLLQVSSLSYFKFMQFTSYFLLGKTSKTKKKRGLELRLLHFESLDIKKTTLR